MNLDEFLDAYVPCRDKIVNLIPDAAVRENENYDGYLIWTKEMLTTV